MRQPCRYWHDIESIVAALAALRSQAKMQQEFQLMREHRRGPIGEGRQTHPRLCGFALWDYGIRVAPGPPLGDLRTSFAQAEFFSV